MLTPPTPLVTRLLPDTTTISSADALHVASHTLPAKK
jgi:hypothetical protein